MPTLGLLEGGGGGVCGDTSIPCSLVRIGLRLIDMRSDVTAEGTAEAPPSCNEYAVRAPPLLLLRRLSSAPIIGDAVHNIGEPV